MYHLILSLNTYIVILNYQACQQRCPSSKWYLLFFQRSWVEFPVTIWQLTTTCNSSSKRSTISSRLWRHQTCKCCTGIHGSTSIYTNYYIFKKLPSCLKVTLTYMFKFMECNMDFCVVSTKIEL